MKFQFKKLPATDVTGDFWVLDLVVPVLNGKDKKVHDKVLNSYRGTTKRDCYIKMVASFGRHVDDYSALIEEV